MNDTSKSLTKTLSFTTQEDGSLITVVGFILLHILLTQGMSRCVMVLLQYYRPWSVLVQASWLCGGFLCVEAKAWSSAAVETAVSSNL